MYDYNIDLTKEIMSGRRFLLLLNNLSNDSALGRIIIGKMNNESGFTSNGQSKPKINWIKNGSEEVMKLKRF